MGTRHLCSSILDFSTRQRLVLFGRLQPAIYARLLVTEFCVRSSKIDLPRHTRRARLRRSLAHIESFDNLLHVGQQDLHTPQLRRRNIASMKSNVFTCSKWPVTGLRRGILVSHRSLYDTQILQRVHARPMLTAAGCAINDAAPAPMLPS